MTTQVLSEAEELCDTILIIDRGRALASGTLEDLRRMSEQMFRVALSFGEVDDVLIGRLKTLDPVEFSANGKSVEMLFRGTEASLLGELADIARGTGAPMVVLLEAIAFAVFALVRLAFAIRALDRAA
jgi:ABC-2 type transport system ATP-binding protein